MTQNSLRICVFFKKSDLVGVENTTSKTLKIKFAIIYFQASGMCNHNCKMCCKQVNFASARAHVLTRGPILPHEFVVRACGLLFIQTNI